VIPGLHASTYQINTKTEAPFHEIQYFPMKEKSGSESAGTDIFYKI
jgi:hypothetical protein